MTTGLFRGCVRWAGALAHLTYFIAAPSKKKGVRRRRAKEAGPKQHDLPSLYVSLRPGAAKPNNKTLPVGIAIEVGAAAVTLKFQRAGGRFLPGAELAMANYVSELEVAKKNLSEALGENVKQYWANLKLWFKQKISKEEFDLEARRLLTQENVHSHNDFLLAILTRCQILVSAPEGAGSLPWTGGSATKPGKPKGKKKFSSVRQKFDHRFQPQNPLSGAQQFVAKDPQEDDDLKLCSHTMMLPTWGQLEGRMIVTAYEHGLDNITEEAVTVVVFALEKHLKDILTCIISKRKAYRLRDGHFKYAFGSNVNPQPYLKNSVIAYNNLTECPPTCLAPPPGQNLASHPPPDDAEQQAALLLACSGDTSPGTLPPVNMYDLFEALQIHREVVPAHTVYALNIERVISKLWHPNHEELQQDKIHRQHLVAKEGLLMC
uniref:Transcriptional adapter 1 n=1 Tax=Pogona vitticeps TaxID=103695 RepID=A0A6J0U2T0_9SAUR